MPDWGKYLNSEVLVPRPEAVRAFRHRLTIAVEGCRTEPGYFELLNKVAPIDIVILTPEHEQCNEPHGLLTRLKRCMDERAPDTLPGDKYWLLFDVDEAKAQSRGY